MTKVPVKNNLDNALKILKRKNAESGQTAILRARAEGYEKKSAKKRRETKEAIKNGRKKNKKDNYN